MLLLICHFPALGSKSKYSSNLWENKKSNEDKEEAPPTDSRTA
jgi:hypothetical protein